MSLELTDEDYQQQEMEAEARNSEGPATCKACLETRIVNRDQLCTRCNPADESMRAVLNDLLKEPNNNVRGADAQETK